MGTRIRAALALVVLAAAVVWAGVAAVAASSGYRAEFSDATGVEPGDDVRIAGIAVGEVTGVRVVRRAVAEVEFTVHSEVRLATSTRAAIRYRDLLGERYLALSEGPGADHRLDPHGVIPLANTRPAVDLNALFNGFRPLFAALDAADVNTFAFQIVQVLQGEAGTVSGLLTHTASLTRTLADRDEVVGRVVTNLNQVLGTLQHRDEQLSGLITELQQLVSGLAADRTAIADSLDSVSSAATATAALVADARPAVKADIAALGEVAGVLAASGGAIETVLRRLPGRLRTLTAGASGTGWFDLYVCGLDLPPEAGTAPAPAPRTPGRCR